MTFDDMRTELLDRFEATTYDRPIEDVYTGLHRRRRRFRSLIATAAAIVVVGTALVIWQPLGQQSSAIAGWTPEPHPGDPAIVAQAVTECRQLSSLPGHEANLPDLGWTDQRGNGLILAYPTPTEIWLCQLVIDDGIKGGGGGSPIEFGPLTGALRVDGMVGYDMHQGGTGVTTVVGQASPEVTRIEVTAPGWVAQASQYDSYWLAWWPAATDASQITVTAYDDTGTLLGTWTGE